MQWNADSADLTQIATDDSSEIARVLPLTCPCAAARRRCQGEHAEFAEI